MSRCYLEAARTKLAIHIFVGNNRYGTTHNGDNSVLANVLLVTRILGVTPAHDINDSNLGQKHHLETIDIFNDNGTLNEKGGAYAGMDRFDVRRKIAQDLQAAGLMIKEEDYTNKVGCSERTQVPIEPKLSMQWFLKMEELAGPALEAVEKDEVRLIPAKFKNTYRHWMENVN